MFKSKGKMEAFKQGAESVAKAAADKADQLASKVDDLKNDFKETAGFQDEVNMATNQQIDNINDEIRILKDNRQYIRSSRHSLDDMEVEEQQLVFTWMQKVLQEMDARGFAISHNQRAYLLNLRRYIGMLDESFQIDNLSVLEKMGEGATHRVIYKIFLSLVYLHNANFAPLQCLADIDGMFKLSSQTKGEEQQLLETTFAQLGVQGIVDVFNQERPINSFTIANVLSSYIEIGSHPALSWNLQKKDFDDYVRAFALLAINAPSNNNEQLFSFDDRQKEFLLALSKCFNSSTIVFDLNDLCKNPRNVNVAALKNILDSDEKKYTWLLDAIFIAGLRDGFKENDDLFDAIVRVVELRDATDFIKTAKKFATATEKEEFVDLIINQIAKRTDGWKHILSFNGLTLTGAFTNIKKRLNDYSQSVWKLESEILFNIQSEARGLLLESPFSQSLKKNGFFKRLNNAKDRAVFLLVGRNSDFGEGHDLCVDALKIINAFTKKYNYSKMLADLYVSMGMMRDEKFKVISGDDWYDDLDRGADKVTTATEGLRDLLDQLEEQIKIIEEGNFFETVEDRRCKAAELKKQVEADADPAKSSNLLVDSEKLYITDEVLAEERAIFTDRVNDVDGSGIAKKDPAEPLPRVSEQSNVSAQAAPDMLHNEGGGTSDRVQEAVTPAKFCSGCGHKLSNVASFAKFCPECGHKLVIEAMKPITEKQTISTVIDRHAALEQAQRILNNYDFGFNETKIHCFPNIPHDKAQKAIATYASHVSYDEVLILVDDTLWGGCKEGIMLTLMELFARKVMEKPRAIPLASIKNITCDKKRIFVNQQDFFVCTMPEKKNVALLAQLMNELAQALKVMQIRTDNQ